MLKKSEYVKLSVKTIENKFMCPICKNTLSLFENSLKCVNNHCFDISKKGCITLMKSLKKRNDKIYDDILFDNRIKFIEGNFYKSLYDIIAKIINNRDDINVIVDMGCGDGAHDGKIYDQIDNKNVSFIGVDISKTGIEYFSNHVDKNFIPIVADLNNMPISDHSVDLILNVLSPSNELEMKRILKENGIIIKVTPKKEYLNELRKAYSIKEYQNEDVIEQNIKNHYVILNKYEFVDHYDIDEEHLTYLLKMTPLTRQINSRVVIKNVTIGLNIYVLSQKKETK